MLKSKVSNFVLAFMLLSVTALQAQQTALKTLSLDDMSAFKPQAGNWFIVGSVMMDPSIDIHPHPAASTTESKSKKKKGHEQANVMPQAVTFEPGKGILLNMNDESKKK